MKILLAIVLHFLLLATFSASLQADPRLPHLFSDHMILQRDAEIRVWGWADPQEKIEIRLAGNRVSISADSNGRWIVAMPPMPAGGPFTLIVEGKKKTIEIKDVLLGEVWVASGQSNMTYALSGATGGAEEISKANDPELRLFTVPQKIALTGQDDTLPAAWQECTPDTAKNFSAVGYFFARSLRKQLGVPVGIILSSWPGSQAEEWTSPESLQREAVLKPIWKRWEDSPAEIKSFAAQSAEFSLEFDDFELLPATGGAERALTLSNFDDGASRTSTGGSWSYDWKGGGASAFELVSPGRGGSGYAARISGKLDGASQSLLVANLGVGGAAKDVSGYAGIRFWVRGSGSFRLQTLQPTIYDWDNYSTDIFQATPEWKADTIWFKDLKQEGWGVTQALTLNALTGIQIVGMTTVGEAPHPPSGLYEGMIVPLANYRVRGAIWYQGEGNTYRAYQYRTLFPTLIHDWRTAWSEGDFPFLIVQLPNQGVSPEFGDSLWAELREAQLFTAKSVKNTGLAVTIDVGDAHNLHPPRKREIGERLAQWALGTTYRGKIEYSGPLYDSMQVKGSEVTIRFSHTAGGLEAHGGELKGFTIAGADRKFHRASARIVGDQVIVSSSEVSVPASVRYAWGDSPECNLYNTAGLPASPFRTDDWPGASFNNR